MSESCIWNGIIVVSSLMITEYAIDIINGMMNGCLSTLLVTFGTFWQIQQSVMQGEIFKIPRTCALQSAVAIDRTISILLLLKQHSLFLLWSFTYFQLRCVIYLLAIHNPKINERMRQRGRFILSCFKWMSMKMLFLTYQFISFIYRKLKNS